MTTTHLPQPKVVAFEGGPCGGKTTIINELAQAMQTANRPFVLLPEVATECISELQASGKSIEALIAHDRSAYIDFETTVLSRIIDSVTSTRAQYQNTNTIIAADRIDIAAYVEPTEYSIILQRLGRMASLLTTDVDTIIYLPTLARSDPIRYEALVGTNASRYERLASQAVAACDATFENVKNHHDLRVYDQPNFAHKIDHVIADVMQIQDGITATGVLR